MACSQNNQTFDSPENVMKYFIDNIKKGNFENVYRTYPFYYDSIIEKTNPKEMINYLDAIHFKAILNMPLQYNSVIKYKLLGEFTTELQRFIFILLLSDEYPEFTQSIDITQRPNPISLTNDALLDNYFSLLDIQNLQNFELVRMDIVIPDIQFSERSKNNTIIHNKIYGCDEKLEYTVLFKNNDYYFVAGITLIRYGSNWYIQELSSSYSRTLNSIRRISGIEEYKNLYEIE